MNLLQSMLDNLSKKKQKSLFHECEPDKTVPRPRLFAQNPMSGEPWYYCGTVTDGRSTEAHRRELATAIGHLAIGEMEGAMLDEQPTFSLDFEVRMMTDAEVEALPDL